jgi:hypothetical protein
MDLFKPLKMETRKQQFIEMMKNTNAWKGKLDLKYVPEVKSLYGIEKVGSLEAEGSGLLDLGGLRIVETYVDIGKTMIKSLGVLEYIGTHDNGILFLNDHISDFGSLKHVNALWVPPGSPFYSLSDEQLKSMIGFNEITRPKKIK